MSQRFTYEPGPEQWKRYLDGRMSPAEKADFETYLQQDPFAQDALEGYSSDPGSLTWFEKEVPAPQLSTGPASNALYLKLSLLFVVCVSALAVGYWFSGGATPGTAVQTTAMQTSLSVPVAQALDSEIRAIEYFEPIAEDRQLTCQSQTRDQKTFSHITLPAQTDEIKTEMDAAFVPEIIPEKKEIHIEQPDPVVNRPVKKMQTLGFYGHKVLDYSNEYTAPIEKRKIELSGIPADRENENARPAEPVERVEKIPYNVYLEETMRYFAARQYRTALKRYCVILAHFPNDLNAAFYSGLCYYNLGKSKPALAAFDRCINDAVDEFRPEAQWCKTLVLLESGRKAEARLLLKEIESEKGFYSAQAKAKLETMK